MVRLTILFATIATAAVLGQVDARPRARDLGLKPGVFAPGALNAIETPIALTNTLSVGPAMAGLVRWTLDQPGHATVRSVNALVGETNDGGLNDIRGQHVLKGYPQP